ncbi:MAG: hypothetical protein ACH37Z_11430 [Anaerolineae bacterium]
MKIRQNGAAWEVISEAGAVLGTHADEAAANAQLALLADVIAEAQASLTVTLREGALATRTQVDIVPRSIRLVEESAGLTWEVCLIEEGWSLNGRYYAWPVLEAAWPLLKELSAGYYEDGEGHTKGDPALLPANCSGWYENFRAERDPQTGKRGIYATFQCIDHKIGGRMAEAWRRGNKTLLGFSIHAYGETIPGLAEGRSGDIVTKIHGFGETTVVRNPAAGGRLIRLVAALNQTENEETNMNLKKWLKARLTESKRDASAVDGMTNDALIAAAWPVVKESVTDAGVLALVKKYLDAGNIEVAGDLLGELISASSGAAAEAPPPGPGMYEAVAATAQTAAATAQGAASQANDALKEAQKLLHEAKVESCKTVLNQVLAEAKLSEAGEKMVRRQFPGIFEKTALAEAVAEVKTIEAPAGALNGGVNQGQPMSAQILVEARDKALMCLELRMGFDPSKDSDLTEAQQKQYRELENGGLPSLKELYGMMTGDKNVTGRYGPGALCEATTADFPYSLAATTNRVTRQVMAETEMPLDQLFVENSNMKDMKTQEVDLWGGFGDMPIVAEGAAYQSGGFPREDRSTYDPEKRGYTVDFTWEMFLNDNLRLLQDIPRKLGMATAHTNELRRGMALTGALTNGVINADTMFTGSVLYHANHRNVGSAALAYTSLLAARQQLEYQFERGNSTLMNDSGGISDSATSVTVVSTAGMFPGQYIQIKGEIIQIAAITSATVLDITGGRGKFGTAADTHADGLRIYQLVRQLVVSKMYVVVPTELRGTLFEILNSEKIPGLDTNTVNFLAAEYKLGLIVPVVVPTMYLGGDSTNWYATNDPKKVPCLEQGYLNKRREGELFVQEAGLYGAVFTNDKITLKQRLVSGHKQIDFVGLVGYIVS